MNKKLKAKKGIKKKTTLVDAGGPDLIRWKALGAKPRPL